jgi:hypothetical protein
MTNKCLIITYGFFGDIFFQSSIARKLKEEKKFDVVDYVVAFPQIYRLLSNNPYIDKVILVRPSTSHPLADENTCKEYNSVIRMKEFSFIDPPPMECQKWAGIDNPDTEFTIYTNEFYDEIAKKTIDDIRNENGKKVIAIPADWKERTFSFTREEYEIGKNSSDSTGYGGKRRNVDKIKDCLHKVFNIVDVGLPIHIKQESTVSVPDDDVGSILFNCSVLKYCDAFVGSESGMCNMASGVGTKTVITGDFVHQLYGWNGVLKKVKEPKLGPIHYFKNKGHVVLDPYLTDEQVTEEIIKNI